MQARASRHIRAAPWGTGAWASVPGRLGRRLQLHVLPCASTTRDLVLSTNTMTNIETLTVQAGDSLTLLEDGMGILVSVVHADRRVLCRTRTGRQ